MAQSNVRTVPTFRAPTAYEEEMMRAKRQQQLAEMLRQQAFTPDEEPYTFQGFRATPSPANAIARVLSAYTSKKLGEKAEEAEGKARQADLEAFEALRRDLGPQTRTVAPDMFGDPMEMGSKYTPLATETVMPTYQQREETLSRALASGTPMAQRYAQLMLSREPQVTLDALMEASEPSRKAYFESRDPTVLAKPPKAPESTTTQRDYEFARSQGYQGSFEDFRQAGTPKTTVDVRYGAPVAGVDAQGNPVFFQPNPTGGPPSVIEGVRPEGKAPTEGQSTARLYAQRMAQAEPMLQSPPPSFGSRFKENLPGGVGNVMLAPESRQFFQAERNFINAVLRKESGAVISDEEFANARRQYIPQPGDDPATLEQKRQNRELAIQEIGAAGGAGYKPPSIGASQVIDLPPRRR